MWIRTVRALRWLFPLVVILFAGIALADGRVAFLAQRLKYPPVNGLPDDFRVRTQAALNLGATDDDAAVEPLCGGLSDPSEVVRHASAVALKRLGRSAGLPCLKARLDQEPVQSVKVQIQRSIEGLEGAGGGGAAIPPGSHYYISLGSVTNQSSRDRGEVESIVQTAIRNKLSSIGGYAFAPSGESPDAARSVMGSNNLKGFYLAPLVNRFQYSGGTLRMTLKVAVFTYPGKDFKGDATVNGSVDGVQQGDKSSENDLLSALAESAAARFAGGFH